MNVLDFNKVEKASFNVALNDENNTKLKIYMPTKGTMDYLKNFRDKFSEDNNSEAEEFMDELYVACAKIMNRNADGIVIERQKIEELLDYEDLIMFYSAFMNFIDEVVNQKN